MKASYRSVLLGLLALALIVVTAFVAEFAFVRGKTPRIVNSLGLTVPGSIASLEKVELGGAEQWVLIRGVDRTKPVLLFLHGGPGMPAMYLAHAFQRELERDFVVVHWDRRGAGKSYDAAIPYDSLNVRRVLDDTHELTRFLRERFGQERIYIAGHSWGSYLGLLAVRERPGDYLAYIGMGQVAGDTARVRDAQREFLVHRATTAGDTALLRRLSHGDARIREDDLFRYGGELHGATNFWPLLATGLQATEYTLTDVMNVKRGAELVGAKLRHNVDPRPLEGEIAEVAVPVFFLLGRHDYSTPSDLAAEYLQRLNAPLKGLVWFEQSAHFPFFEESERFHSTMLRVDRAVREFWSVRAPTN